MQPVTQFLETLCIQDGIPLNLDWHQKRVEATLRHFHADSAQADNSIDLQSIFSVMDVPQEGVWRCRVIYSIHSVSVEFIPDGHTTFRTLKLVEVPSDYDYRYKYADRRFLGEIFAQRGEADDVLMVRQGCIADTTKGNIAFRTGLRWYTPSLPFLAGTTWKRLVSSGVLIPRPVHISDLDRFEAFKVVNALNDWDGEEYPVSGIVG